MSTPPFIFSNLLSYRSREHLQRMDDRDRRELLRELLGQGQSEAAWGAILELFASWPEGDEKADALGVAEQALDAWDDQLRHVASSWRYLYEGEGLASLARLVCSIKIYRREQHGTRELYAIASSEHARNLKYLTVVKSELWSRGVRALADSPYLAGLRHLEIRRTLLFDEDADYLLRPKGLAGLRNLRLIEAGLKPAPLGAAVNAHFTGLRELDLSENFIKSEGLSSLSRAPWLASVEKLELRRNHIEDDGAEAFAKSPYARALTLLDLSDNWLTQAGKNILLGMSNEKGFKLIL